MDAEDQKPQDSHVSEKAPSSGEDGSDGRVTMDPEAHKKLLRRIDWRVMPVVSPLHQTIPRHV